MPALLAEVRSLRAGLSEAAADFRRVAAEWHGGGGPEGGPTRIIAASCVGILFEVAAERCEGILGGKDADDAG